MVDNHYNFIETKMASSYASAILAVIILSVCLSHVCFVTKPNNALLILIPHKRTHS